VEYALFQRFFAHEVEPGTRDPATDEAVPKPVFALVTVALTLGGFVVASAAGVNPAWAALAGALVLAGRALAQRRTDAQRILHSAAVYGVPVDQGVACLIAGRALGRKTRVRRAERDRIPVAQTRARGARRRPRATEPTHPWNTEAHRLRRTVQVLPRQSSTWEVAGLRARATVVGPHSGGSWWHASVRPAPRKLRPAPASAGRLRPARARAGQSSPVPATVPGTPRALRTAPRISRTAGNRRQRSERCG
jgi:hypothetical protein